MAQQSKSSENPPSSPRKLSAISITGFKSLRDRSTLRMAPLTLLSGANSAGKSSIMQALLLIKQTQEATHDPGGLLLDGPCVHAKSAEALLWNGGDKKKKAEIWSIELDYGPDRVVQVDYQRQPTGGFVPLRTRERTERGELVLEAVIRAYNPNDPLQRRI